MKISQGGKNTSAEIATGADASTAATRIGELQHRIVLFKENFEAEAWTAANFDLSTGGTGTTGYTASDGGYYHYLLSFPLLLPPTLGSRSQAHVQSGGFPLTPLEASSVFYIRIRRWASGCSSGSTPRSISSLICRG